jgi:cysteine desulfurase
MKINCDPSKLKADLISVSGHKIGAPKGIGALVCHNSLITKKIITPIIFGGGQENGYRSGTENMPGIAALSEAVRIKKASADFDKENVIAVREAIISSLPEGVSVNLPKGEYLPNIISLCAHGVKSEVLVRALSTEGICVSAGSACSSKKLKTSTALTAFGLTPDRADSTFRVSLSGENTVEEASAFCSVLGEVLKRLAKKH